MLIYLATALLYAHNTPGRLGNAADATLLFGPAVAGFGLQAGLVHDIDLRQRPSPRSASARSTSALAALTLRERRDEMRLLSECLIAIGVGFVTLAVPLALEVEWTSAAWALEGAGAFWVGMRQARWMPRAFGLALIGVAAADPAGDARAQRLRLAARQYRFRRRCLGRRSTAGGGLVAARRAAAAQRLAAGQGLRAVEASLAKPLFLAGFGFACLALVQEVTRAIPPGPWTISPSR